MSAAPFVAISGPDPAAESVGVTLDRLAKVRSVTVVVGKDPLVFTRIEPDGTLSCLKNEELGEVLSPLLELMRREDEKRVGGGVYPLRRFVGRLYAAGLLEAEAFSGAEVFVSVKTPEDLRVFAVDR